MKMTLICAMKFKLVDCVPGWMNYSVKTKEKQRIFFAHLWYLKKSFKKLAFDSSDGASMKNEHSQEPITTARLLSLRGAFCPSQTYCE